MPTPSPKNEPSPIQENEPSPSQKNESYLFLIIDYLKTAKIPLIETYRKQIEENLIKYFKDIQQLNPSSQILITSEKRLSDASDSQKEYIGEIFSSAFKEFKKQQQANRQDTNITLSREFLPAQVSIPSPPASKTSLSPQVSTSSPSTSKTSPTPQVSLPSPPASKTSPIQAGAAGQSNKAKLQKILIGEKIYEFYKAQIGEKNMEFYQNFIGLVDQDRIIKQINLHAGALNSYPEMKPIYDKRIEQIEQGLNQGFTLNQSEREMNDFRRLTEEQGQMKKAFELFENMVAGKGSGDKGNSQLMPYIYGQRPKQSGEGGHSLPAHQGSPTRQPPPVGGGGFGGGTHGALNRSSSSQTPSKQTPSKSPSLRSGGQEINGTELLEYVGRRLSSGR